MNVFKRYELKYMLTKTQYERLCKVMQGHMELDTYGRHTIRNIYFDTADYRIIRHSIDKPKYKEKLRLRCYGEPKEDASSFIELKKKFNGVVYKRRIESTQSAALSFLLNGDTLESASQIGNEIAYFKENYKDLAPRVHLRYEREAYFSRSDENFRMTFDFNIKARTKHVSLYGDERDVDILDADKVLLEVKTVQGLPNWFLMYLSENSVYKTSFSKVGTAYMRYVMPKFAQELRSVSNG